MDRDTILRRFTERLDQALSSEEPPQGIPEEILRAEAEQPELAASRATDLYSMQAALTALTQEVKLQGRSFKQLAETVEPVLQVQLAEIRREADERARKEVMDALLDIRDRLARGLDAVGKACAAMEQSRRSWWLPGRNVDSARGTVTALRDGYRLTAERLDETLERFQVKEIDCLLQPFDPQRMQAVDTEETTGAPEGAVVEVYRRGYEWNGRLYRPAEVKVARRPGLRQKENA